jgi:hypothetical protein
MSSKDNDSIQIVVTEKQQTPDTTIEGSPILKAAVKSTDEHNSSASSVIEYNDNPNEVDNLNEMDLKEISQLKSPDEELIRLFRSLTVLTPVQVRVIELRYLGLLATYSKRIVYVDILHHFTRSFVSLGSVIVPALLSIQSPTSLQSTTLYWITWVISVLVTAFHNIITIFRFDKKYFALHNTYEKLQTEGWAYLQLAGRYSGHHPTDPKIHIIPTHKNQYPLFVHNIEKIQMRQIADEYNGQANEKHQQQQFANNNQNISGGNVISPGSPPQKNITS